MTQARTRAHEVGSPSLRQLSLAAMLRMFVELVLHAASTLRMIRRRLPAECHSDATPADLPGRTTGHQQQEANIVAASDNCPTALMMSSARSARPSNHEGVLTDASHTLAHHRDRPFLVPLIPAKAGTQSNSGIVGCPHHAHTPPRIPAFAGMSGETACNFAPA